MFNIELNIVARTGVFHDFFVKNYSSWHRAMVEMYALQCNSFFIYCTRTIVQNGFEDQCVQ